MRHIDDAEERLRDILAGLQSRQISNLSNDRKKGRALSLAITKLEECLMWLTQADAP